MIGSIGSLGDQKTLENQVVNHGLPQGILQAIKSASSRTGVDFAYLVNKASQESSFDPNAKASTSSATGLYQFTSQTWLCMIKQHGAQYGLSAYANKITTDANGGLHVNDPAARHAILNLRTDPQTSALMAGELDKQNSESLQQNVGGKIGATELYLAHFLGAGGASDFLNKMRSNPRAPAAAVLPEAASANSSVFYNADGSQKTLGQIYQHFAQKFNGTSSAATMIASAAPTVPIAPATTPTALAVTNTSFTSLGSFFTPPNATPVSSFANNNQPQSMGTSSLFATMALAQGNSLSDLALTDMLKLPNTQTQNRNKPDGASAITV